MAPLVVIEYEDVLALYLKQFINGLVEFRGVYEYIWLILQPKLFIESYLFPIPKMFDVPVFDNNIFGCKVLLNEFENDTIFPNVFALDVIVNIVNPFSRLIDKAFENCVDMLFDRNGLLKYVNETDPAPNLS